MNGFRIGNRVKHVPTGRVGTFNGYTRTFGRDGYALVKLDGLPGFRSYPASHLAQVMRRKPAPSPDMIEQARRSGFSIDEIIAVRST